MLLTALPLILVNEWISINPILQIRCWNHSIGKPLEQLLAGTQRNIRNCYQAIIQLLYNEVPVYILSCHAEQGYANDGLIVTKYSQENFMLLWGCQLWVYDQHP